MWSLVLWNLYLLGSSEVRPAYALLAPLLLCGSALFRVYCLRNGSIMTESVSIALLCLSLIFLVRGAVEKRISMAITSGLVLAVAAYIRAQTEMIGALFSCLVVVWSCCILVKPALAYLQQSRDSSADRFMSILHATLEKNYLTGALIAVLVFNCLTVPYKLYNLHVNHSFAWLPSIDYFWKLGWMPEADLLKRGDDFVINGGGTIPAQLNPKLANEIKIRGIENYSESYCKSRTITVFLTHPLQWIWLETSYVPNYWLDPLLLGGSSIGRQFMIVENMLYLLFVAVVITLVLTTLVLKTPAEFVTASLLLLATLISSAATLIFLHLEWRYFYTIKLLSFVGVFLYVILRCTKGKNRCAVINNSPGIAPATTASVTSDF